MCQSTWSKKLPSKGMISPIYCTESLNSTEGLLGHIAYFLRLFWSNPIMTTIQGAIVIRMIGASLSKPHTSKSSGASVGFTKIYKIIRINGCICKHLCLKTDKNRITYKCFWHVHSLHKQLLRQFTGTSYTVKLVPYAGYFDEEKFDKFDEFLVTSIFNSPNSY